MQMTGRNLENMESRRDGFGGLSPSCVCILLSAGTGFSADPARCNINCVSLCPGTQEVQPHHQRYSIPSNNEVLRQCNGKREISRGDGRGDINCGSLRVSQDGKSRQNQNAQSELQERKMMFVCLGYNSQTLIMLDRNLIPPQDFQHSVHSDNT